MGLLYQHGVPYITGFIVVRQHFSFTKLTNMFDFIVVNQHPGPQVRYTFRIILPAQVAVARELAVIYSAVFL